MNKYPAVITVPANFSDIEPLTIHQPELEAKVEEMVRKGIIRNAYRHEDRYWLSDGGRLLGTPQIERLFEPITTS